MPTVTPSPLVMSFAVGNTQEVIQTPEAVSSSFSFPQHALPPPALVNSFAFPTPQINQTISPSPLTTSFNFPAALGSVGQTVTPSPLVISSAVGNTQEVIQAVDAITADFFIPAHTSIVTNDQTVTPPPLVMEAVVTFDVGGTFEVDPLTSTFNFPVPSIAGGISAPSPLVSTFSFPTTIARKFPDALQVSTNFPTATVSVTGLPQPDPLEVAFSFPIPIVGVDQPDVIIRPLPLKVSTSFPLALGSVDQVVSASPLVIQASFPSVSAGTTFRISLPTDVKVLHDGGKVMLLELPFDIKLD